MILFPGMIAEAARQAGMKVPENPDKEFSVEEFPHFGLFCAAQLGHRIPYFGVHWENAKVVAGIAESRIPTLTIQELLDAGFKG